MGTGRLRIGIVAIWLVVFSNGLLFFLARRVFNTVPTWSGPVLRPAIVLSIGLGVAMVALDRHRASGRSLRPVAAVPFVAATAFGAWAALSTFWSLEPGVTLWRGLGYVFLPCVAWVIADLSAPAWRRALAIGCGLLVALSLVVVAVKPSWGTDNNLDWRGVMTSRNSFAPICALAVFAGISLWWEGRHVPGAALVALSVSGLIGAGSRTAWFAFALALGFSAAVTMARRAHLARPRRSLVIATVATTVSGAGAVVAGGAVLWDEATFAQRREIWDLLGPHIADAPLVGIGWAAFWHHTTFHTHPLLQRGSAHGAVPELLLGGGAVALLLWLVVVGVAVAGLAREMWRSPSNEVWLWTAIVTFLLVENLTESYVLWFSYNWVVLIAAALRFGAVRSGFSLASPGQPRGPDSRARTAPTSRPTKMRPKRSGERVTASSSPVDRS